MRDDIEKILGQDAFLYSKDGNWRSYYQDVADFSLPRKAWITSIKATGEQLKYNFLYDVRVIRDVKKASAGFHSQLCNPASKWWGMTTRDVKYRDSRASQIYFKDCEDIQYSVMNNSNFDAEIQEHFTDDIVFGMGNVLTLDDPIDEVNYQEIPIEQYSIEEDARGRVIAMYRTFEYSAVTCWGLWGDKCSREIKDCIRDKKYYIMFKILHYVGPRDRRDVMKKDSRNMPWASMWIVKQGGHLLDESGFEEFPYSVDRFWKDANETRGYSPVMDILASVKLLNAEKRTLIKTAMMMAGPPHLLPSKGFVLPFNLNPHASNYYDPSKTTAEAFKQIESKGNIPLTVEVMKLEQDEIDQGLFIPQFESLANITKQMTVPEVQRRVAESMYLLGPAVGRMTKTLRNILFRTYAILNRKGLLPEPPDELKGKDLEIMFLSPLAKAQRASELSNLTTFLQIAGEMGQFKPEVLDTLDADHILEIVGEVQGVDPTVFVEKKKVEEIRANRAKQQATIMAMQLAESGTKSMQQGAQGHKAMQEAGATK